MINQDILGMLKKEEDKNKRYTPNLNQNFTPSDIYIFFKILTLSTHRFPKRNAKIMTS